MPFNRRWDPAGNEYIIDRDLTGPPPPPSTGTTQTDTGVIVGDASNIDVPPATPVKVNLPGPNEAVLDSRGVMRPRWYRFFLELYRRTGAIEDNINNTSRQLGGSATTGSLVLTGAAPSAEISVTESPAAGSLSLTGIAPTVVVA